MSAYMIKEQINRFRSNEKRIKALEEQPEHWNLPEYQSLMITRRRLEDGMTAHVKMVVDMADKAIALCDTYMTVDPLSDGYPKIKSILEGKT